MKVLKFGGSSIGSADRIRNAKQIIDGQKVCIIVVSALEGITDRLLTLAKSASQNNPKYKDELSSIITFHQNIITELKLTSIQSKFDQLVKELRLNVDKAVTNNDISARTIDSISGYGELLSSLIVSAFIGVELVDARELIITGSDFGNAKVDLHKTEKNIFERLGKINTKIVVPGFVATSGKGEMTTLGRGGSDYSAALIAAALNADAIEIWTNVDGFMTADPKIVSKAHAIEQMSYAEAIELSHFGARVVYTPTIQPVLKKGIPIIIKNTFNPVAKGTVISQFSGNTDTLIKGVSSISDVHLISLQGTGMVGVPGTSKRLFGALAEGGANVILITQASSEFSISFAVSPEQSADAVASISKEFAEELKSKELHLNIEENLSIVAIVGEQMKNTPGISARLFQSLARNGISVIATAQGSSELNISIVLKKDNLRKALNSIHEGFFLSGYKELNLYLVGTGVVGGALIKQIFKQQPVLMKSHQLKINVVGIANIDKMLFVAGGIDLNTWEKDIDSKGEAINLDGFTARIKELNLRNSVFVDCTAHPAVASQYYNLLNSFVSVVTPNKIACSSEYKHYRLLIDTAKARGARFLYETNVGAGLPVINTMRDLILSGDQILKIEAVLSGTLNFIFNTISADIPLSQTIRLAKEKGYSEPDPRIDLSGTDVVRKILILSREAGYEMEKQDIEVNTFLPSDCFEGDIDVFWKKVLTHDNDFEARRKVLDKEGKRWRFVARLEHGKASVRLIEVDMNHPAYVLEGSNNIIILTTERYKELPMVIKGYGAGADVTAAGIFADIIRCANLK